MLFEGLPSKKYNCLVIDCPWPIRMMGRMKKARNQRPDHLKYKTLSLDEIKSFPLSTLANPGAHVYCWTVNSMLPHAFDVLDAWGVRFHLCMPLVKKSGMVPGRGYIFGAEYCLLGFHNPPMQPFIGIGKLNWLTVNPTRGKHSVKPDSFYDLVETMSPGPRIDIFSRRERKNWDVWGDEVTTIKHDNNTQRIP